MSAIHSFRALLWAAVALNGFVFLVSFFLDLARLRVPSWLWATYLLACVLVGLQGLSGVTLYLSGFRPANSLHLLYGLLSLGGALAGFSLRPGGFLRAQIRPFREARAVALLSVTVAALLLRAYQTGLPR